MKAGEITVSLKREVKTQRGENGDAGLGNEIQEGQMRAGQQPRAVRGRDRPFCEARANHERHALQGQAHGDPEWLCPAPLGQMSSSLGF